MLALEVKERDVSESAETVRGYGAVPAVFYGPKEKATSIAIESLELERVWRAAGETTIVRLKGIGDEKDALFHDVQVHPVTGKLLHADFYVLEKGKKVQISVPLVFEGMAPAEKAGYVVVKTLHEVEIEVAPQELPHSLSVNLATLENVGDHIVVSQIPLPASATLITDAEEIVVSVKEFKEEAEEIKPPPETEIIGEKKEGAEKEETGASGAKDAPSPAGKEKKE